MAPVPKSSDGCNRGGGHERLHHPSRTGGQANEPSRVERGRYLQEEHVGTMLLKIVLLWHDLPEIGGPDVGSVEPCRCRHEHNGGGRCREDGSPAPRQHQHQRKQQSELRLDCENAE